jgi:hypothetical protein
MRSALKSAKCFAAVAVAAGSCVGAARADDVVLSCSRDNTLIELGGDLSNGAGDGIYSGLTLRDGLRRALVRFDTGSIPAGSTITSVSLQLTLVNTSGFDGPSSLHRMLADWGEGTSASAGGVGAPATTGDATWAYRLYNTDPWTVPGGDFVTTASSTTTIVTIAASQSFPSSVDLVADVQRWVDFPAQNFGWAIVGDETSPQSARRFASREFVTPAQRPSLLVSYTPPVATCPADFNHSGVASVQDIFDFLAAYFAGDPRADFNASGVISVQDIFDFLAAYFAGC